MAGFRSGGNLWTMLKEFGPSPVEDRNMIRRAEFQEDNCNCFAQGIRRVFFTFKGRNSPALIYVY